MEFLCNVCNKKFARKFTLVRHMANIHRKEKEEKHQILASPPLVKKVLDDLQDEIKHVIAALETIDNSPFVASILKSIEKQSAQSPR